jgi:hypothetical protein
MAKPPAVTIPTEPISSIPRPADLIERIANADSDLLCEHETEIRRCLKKGAHKVHVDFTEGRLAVKIDQRVFGGRHCSSRRPY